MAIVSRRKIKEQESIEKGVREYFDVLNFYTPTFTTVEGGVYEMELTRSAIHTFANHCSNLEPHVYGAKAGNSQLARALTYRPNDLMDGKKYLYRLATMIKVCNNAFVVPMYDQYRQRIIGFYPVHPSKCRVERVDGEAWLLFTIQNGDTKCAKLSEVGRLTQMQNTNELFGDSNRAMQPTLELLNAQNQAILESVENSSNIKFLAKLTQTLRPEDIDKERNRFANSNFRNNKSSVLMVDGKYADVRQLDSKQFVIDDKQMQLIRENVYCSFGVSENLIKNTFTADEWNAYYESQVEPFALELGLVHSNLLYTDREIEMGNKVEFTANRMNYLGTQTKVQLIQTLFDRGLLTPNEARTILDMPKIENGDNFYIRKEYTDNYNEEGSDNDTNQKE